MIYKNYILFLLLCVFSWTVFAQSLLRELFPEYETCSCTNDKFTKQLTQPYEEEIQLWLLQTQEERILPTINNTIVMEDPEYLEDEDTSFLSSIENFFTGLADTIVFWDDEEEEIQAEQLLESLPFPSTPLSASAIPSICFAMSGNMIKNEGIQKQFHSCIYKHYDNSDEDNFCFNTRNQPNSLKKCDVLPIPCDSSNDLNLTCPKIYRDRTERHGDNGCNKGAVFPRRPCLSQDYIAMTAKAFHDVAECLDIAPEMAFPIFLHESRFILNIQSHTGALCYGQITSNAVADFNSFLKSHKGYPNYDIPDLLEKNIEKRCPHVWKNFKKVSTIVREDKTLIRSDFDQCKINTNPYTCFFYGFAYLKILHEKAQQEITETNNIHVAVLEDNSLQFLNNPRYSHPSLLITETKKLKLFADEQELLNILTVLSYNGGLSIIRIHFNSFMARLKTSLIIKTNTELQNAILNNGGLTTDFFKTGFMNFLKERYSIDDNRRNGELFSYLDKVISEVQALNQLIRELHPTIPNNFDVCPFLIK